MSARQPVGKPDPWAMDPVLLMEENERLRALVGEISKDLGELGRMLDEQRERLKEPL